MRFSSLREYVLPFRFASLSELRPLAREYTPSLASFRFLRCPAFQLTKNGLPNFFQIVVVLHFCLLLGHAKPTRDAFPRVIQLSRQPNFFCPRIHAACDLTGGNIAFELF